MAEVIAIVLAYLWGAVPTAYLLARWRRGIDIRRYGTGNVGASNVMMHLGKRIGLTLGLFDGLVKGTLPVILAKLLGLSMGGQIGVALASVSGHNWSPFLSFTGGRGVATALGTYVGFGLWQQLLAGILIVGLLGWVILRNLALWMLIGMAFMALLAYLLGQSTEMVYLLLGLVGLVAAKRLSANWVPPLTGQPLWRVLLYRLLYDRDVARRDEWVRRNPEERQDPRRG